MKAKNSRNSLKRKHLFPGRQRQTSAGKTFIERDVMKTDVSREKTFSLCWDINLVFKFSLSIFGSKSTKQIAILSSLVFIGKWKTFASRTKESEFNNF